jgi:hypothetical protein
MSRAPSGWNQSSQRRRSSAPGEACAVEDTGRFNNPAADEAFYDATQTYSLPVVYPKNAGVLEDVEKLAPKAGYLLTQAFSSLSLEQADKILTETEGPGGGFLDNGSEFGVYSRLNIYAAARRAEKIVAGAKTAHAGLSTRTNIRALRARSVGERWPASEAAPFFLLTALLRTERDGLESTLLPVTIEPRPAHHIRIGEFVPTESIFHPAVLLVRGSGSLQWAALNMDLVLPCNDLRSWCSYKKTAIAEDALSAWLNLIMRRWTNLILGFWKADPIKGHWSVGSYRRAPTFRQDSISPNASKPADSLTSTYNSKAASCLKRQALDVFRYGGCLQSPDPMLLRRFYKCFQQDAPNATAAH